MFVARDKDGKLCLWYIKPVRYKERLKECSEYFQKEEKLLTETTATYLENFNDYWTYPYQFTKEFYHYNKDYLDGADLAELDSHYVIYLDEKLFPDLKWEDEPREVFLFDSSLFENVSKLITEYNDNCHPKVDYIKERLL